MVEISGQSYGVTVGSDIQRDGVYLEVDAAAGAVLAEVFYCDGDHTMTFTGYRDVSAHVGCEHVRLRTDERDKLLHIAARERLELAPGQPGRIDGYAALPSAIGQTGQGAFPTHPDRECADLAHINAGGKARAALRRPEGEMVLDAIALIDGHRAVVAVDWARHRDGAFGHEDSLALVGAQIEEVRHVLELLASHLEGFAGVNARQHATPRILRCAPLVRAAADFVADV